MSSFANAGGVQANVSPLQRYVTLDGMRGIAAIIVATMHFGRTPIFGGYLAVDFFFLLSGFVLTRAYGARLAEGDMFIDFARIRAIRLFPIHVIGTLFGASYIVFGILRHWQQTMTLTVLSISTLLNLLLIPAPFVRALFPINGPAWSLFFEMIASLALPSLIIRCSNRTIFVCCAMFGALLAGFCYSLEGNEFSDNSTISPISLDWGWDTIHIGLLRAAFSFPLGVLVARLRSGQPRIVSHWAVLVMFTLIAALMMRPTGIMRLWYDFACIGILFPLILVAGSRREPKSIIAVFARFAGDISYPLYATHFTLCSICWYYLERKYSLSHGVALAIYLAAAIVLAWLVATRVDPLVRRRLTRWFPAPGIARRSDRVPVPAM